MQVTTGRGTTGALGRASTDSRKSKKDTPVGPHSYRSDMGCVLSSFKGISV
ncbi:hypothetical protein BXY39_0863 [Eilatimonas milleporae]|uniref:Uncharacterized protein n=1 Tax=Eilatimonas milleporae TaxID=911205 RepID=A0A3M0CTI9_9PROT|nr:hypothetical protein BXY39_0863 [Eilatimonas milleporae]